MDRAVIEPLIQSGMTQREVADKLDVSCSTVRHWAKKYGLVFSRAHNKRYSSEQLEAATAESNSVMEVMRKLDMRMAGGSHYHLSQRIQKMGLDTSHFTRQAHNKGKPSPRKLTADEILVELPKGHFKPKTDQLKRALLEKAIPYLCSFCEISEWNGRPISLDVDHVNGDWLNNKLDNLRFLCPNCHRQTDTFGSKNNKAL